MADAWGGSFGSSWGQSFGDGGGGPVSPPVVEAKTFTLYDWPDGSKQTRPAPALLARGLPSWLANFESAIGEFLPLIQRINFVGGDSAAFFGPAYATPSQRFTMQRSQSYEAGEMASDGLDGFYCVTTGSTAVGAPTFNRTLGATTVDGSVTWRCVKRLGVFAPNYDTLDGNVYTSGAAAGYSCRIGSTADTGNTITYRPTYTSNTITAAGAQFVTDGLTNGVQIEIAGTLNNGVTATISNVTESTITVSGTPFAAGTDNSDTAKIFAPMPSWEFTNRWFPPSHRAHTNGIAVSTIGYYGLAEVALRMHQRLLAKPSKTLGSRTNAESRVICQDVAQNIFMRERIRHGGTSAALWYSNFTYVYLFPRTWQLDLQLTTGRLKDRPSIYSAPQVESIALENDFTRLDRGPWTGGTPGVASFDLTRETAYGVMADIANHEIQNYTSRAQYQQGTRGGVTDAAARWYLPCLVNHLHQAMTNTVISGYGGVLPFQLGLTCLALINWCDRERAQGRNPNDFHNPNPPGLSLGWTTTQYVSIEATIEKFCDWLFTAPLIDAAGVPRPGLFSRNIVNSQVLHVFQLFSPGDPGYIPANDVFLQYQSELMALLALPYFWVAEQKRQYRTSATARTALQFFDEGDLLVQSNVSSNAFDFHLPSYAFGFYKQFNQRNRPILSHILPLRNAMTGRED